MDRCGAGQITVDSSDERWRGPCLNPATPTIFVVPRDDDPEHPALIQLCKGHIALIPDTMLDPADVAQRD